MAVVWTGLMVTLLVTRTMLLYIRTVRPSGYSTEIGDRSWSRAYHLHIFNPLVPRCIWHGEEGTGRGDSPPRPLLAVPNLTAHPSTASVPITVLIKKLMMVMMLYSLMLCGFNVPIKGLTS